MGNKKQISLQQRNELFEKLKVRFEKNPHRHKGIEWAKVQTALEASGSKLWSLQEMERTGGEPDVVGFDKKTGEYLFFDCSSESPAGRRSTCFDREGLESRKEHPPQNTAMDMAAEMGIELLSEEQYRTLQQLGPFDLGKRRAGFKHLQRSENSAEHSSRITVMAMSSCIIMVHNLIMRREVLEDVCGCD
jgi:hypothetical protein